ncbi:GntR family transcriptional regulator [Blastococcus sp. TF02A-26]|uniref:GntR family transcriptional regulator n=1 Tax=Blastococcus sp. TF02A-26 TaxID=2250577 RepID=UPI000DEA8CF9|nr:GntR family transcriptional regulator [Blastococcus sp. TF02A-26]RBY82809.1 GntR family transcriptional regulator [Blastococcus sp. TF02A-26]
MTEARVLEIVVAVDGPVPPYEQIRSQIAELVHNGALAEGDRLPTVRALAADLGVAAGTVARAYTELETDGLVEGRRRFGTVVTGGSGDPARARLRAAANRLISAARADGLDDDAVLTAVQGALEDRRG